MAAHGKAKYFLARGLEVDYDKIADEEHRKICRAWNETELSLREVGTKFQKEYGGIRYILLKNGFLRHRPLREKDEYADFSVCIERERLEDIINPLHQRVCEVYYFSDVSHFRIANDLGMGQRTVSKILMTYGF